MLLLYVSLLVFFAFVQLLLRWRVKRLERRYVRVASDAAKLLEQANRRSGNTSRVDPLALARQQYEMAQLAVKRDLVEKRYANWQSASENFAHRRGKLAAYRGKVLPYLTGVVDVAGGLVLLERFGPGLSAVKTLMGLGE